MNNKLLETTTTDGLLKMEAFYEQNKFIVEVTNIDTGTTVSKEISASFVPKFGIDVEDMTSIYQAAEELIVLYEEKRGFIEEDEE